MFNFAAAMSKKSRTKVVTFVSEEADGDIPAGGGGDERRGYPGTQGGASKNNPGRGRSTGRALVWAPRDQIFGDSKIKRNPEPLQKGVRLRRILSRKGFWRVHRTKVHPLSITNDPLSPRSPQYAKGQTAGGLHAAASLTTSAGKRGQQLKGPESWHILSNARGFDSKVPSSDENHPLAVTQRKSEPDSSQKSKKSWKNTLRRFLTRRRRQNITAVVPFKIPGKENGQPRDDQNDLMTGRETMKARENVSTAPGATATSVKKVPNQLALPGVPQFDLENHLEPSEAPRGAGKIPGRQETWVATPCSSSKKDEPVTVSASPRKQRKMREGQDEDDALKKKTSSPTLAAPLSTKMREGLQAKWPVMKPAPVPLPLEPTSRKSEVKTSDFQGMPFAKPVLFRRTLLPKVETTAEVQEPEAGSVVGIASRKQYLTGLLRKSGATLRVEKIAVKVNVEFIFLTMVGRSPAVLQQSRWVEVLASCVHRTQELHRLMSCDDCKQESPCNNDLLKEIERNGKVANEKLNLLKQLVIAANHLQPKDSATHTGLFRFIGISPPKGATWKLTPAGYGNKKRLPVPSKEDPDLHPNISDKRQILPPQTSSSEGAKRMMPLTSVASTSPSGKTLPGGDGKKKPVPLPSRAKHGPLPSISSRRPKPLPPGKITPSPARSGHMPSTPVPTASLCTPSGKTLPKMAPSCLQKVMPSLKSYPTIDAGDLEYVMSPTGVKVVLGQGDHGEILLMRRRDDGVFMAVKRLPKNRFRITVDKGMLREAAAMRAVRNSPFFPKLVGIIDYCSFAQEFIGDPDTNQARDFLSVRYQYGLLTAREWMYVCRDIAEGLRALHRAGWLHNDLHGGNAMVCRNPPGSGVGWTGKIIDLGCAERLKSLPPPLDLTKLEKEVFYKLCEQVAPEIVEGTSLFSVKGDIFSLGKLFVDMAWRSSSLHTLRHLGLTCMSRTPASRPTLTTVCKRLDTLCSKARSTLRSLPPPPPPS